MQRQNVPNQNTPRNVYPFGNETDHFPELFRAASMNPEPSFNGLDPFDFHYASEPSVDHGIAPMSFSNNLSASDLLDDIFAAGGDSRSNSSFLNGLELDATLDSLGCGFLSMPATNSSAASAYSQNDQNGQASSSRMEVVSAEVNDERCESSAGNNQNGSHENMDISDCENDDESLGSSFCDDDIDAMLEKVDTESSSGAPRHPLITSREHFFLVERGHQHFELLPEGWIKVVHRSGMPIYCHRATKVCSLSRPYVWSAGSLRSHRIPLSAIPCLEYRKLKEEASATTQSPTEGAPETNAPVAKLVTGHDFIQKTLLAPEEIREYCSKVFDFDRRTIRRYKNWKIGRGQLKIAKKIKNQEKIPDPEAAAAAPSVTHPNSILKNATLLTVKLPATDGKPAASFVVNIANKSPVTLLHEFIQQTRKTQPTYEFIDMLDSNTPFEAIAKIDGKEEGRGFGANKKAAKAEAAKNTLCRLIPEYKSVVGDGGDGTEDIFKEMAIDDNRIYDVAQKTGAPGPHHLLTLALKRLYGGAPEQVKMESQKESHLKNKYTLTTPKHSVSVIAGNPVRGKNLAAQELLKKMHPECKSYGELLDIYGRKYQQEMKNRKEIQRSITDLQGKAGWGEPNWELLEKLRQEMKKVVPLPLQPGETSRIRYD